ncbi:hypothetical protein P5673_024579 [Acropora cervicornis]|uniref:Uncharacterized protein n=1 Tax=Acropora cervicornis TaxID=6130 RepID=A0AAD9Q3C4_ACRCE|nr:hypothetical protein P5673_024579 [Acropora cervicornis]
MADKKPVLAHSNGDKRSKSSLTCGEYADERAAENTINASQLDPSLISRELRSFANDALGVDKLQVR